MKLDFLKYHGTGNDFIIIDNRKGVFNPENTQVAQLCNRRLGIGADGLILLQEKKGYDFEMIYYNSDGNQGSMCGNGGRCIVEYAHALGLVKDRAHFIAIDGEHEALIHNGIISLKMKDVDHIEEQNDFCFVNTGSPHYVAQVKDVKNTNVVEEGRKIRYSERFTKEGTNVNFIEKVPEGIFVRTYERGVEDETWSCGTGVTASALVAAVKGIATADSYCDIQTLGGKLRVKFLKASNYSFRDVWLEGPATLVFKGSIEV